ncbi:MAG: glycosyltransferase family protein [Flavobacteriales bacterium]|nr:glycosyltransferase family protein [Flavobacteriales bacterium]
MTVAILQARMGSTRLPGKVLTEVHGNTILGHLIERLTPAKSVDDFVIATTSNEEDDAIEAWCNENGVNVFRGSDWDVLERFWGAVNMLEETPDTIVRICCDNPLHSHKVLDFVVNAHAESGKVYFSNSNQEPDYLEDGFDVEVFTYEALKEANEKAKLMSEREHVCPYIKKHFSCGWKKADNDYMFKLSVDTPADLNMVKRIFEELETTPDFSIQEVTKLLREKPEILEINKESKINSGFAKSINEDRIVK